MLLNGQNVETGCCPAHQFPHQDRGVYHIQPGGHGRQTLCKRYKLHRWILLATLNLDF